MGNGRAVYLDHNATAPVRPEVARAVVEALGVLGNPSSVHGFGRAARRLVEDSRELIAGWLGARPAGVIFTSGGSEANTLAMLGRVGRRRLVSAVEHPSLRDVGATEAVPVDGDGVLDLARLDSLLAGDRRPALVAVMLANNETGVIQPVAEAARIAHAHGALLHCDAVQAAGRMAVDLGRLGADSLSVSAHKLGGPTGIGALVLADPEEALEPLLKGGGQERRRRAGTENVCGIAGFAAAVEASCGAPGLAASLAVWRDGMEAALRAACPSLVVFGAAVERLTNTSCLAVPGLTARTAVMALDLAGVAVSAGAACSSGSVAPSHVLEAMGAGPLAQAAIRISLGWSSRKSDIDAFVDAFLALPGVAAAKREVQAWG
ncbi:MAG TPA: cysteine desulfurase [Rhodospirillaceae bacterium]|nr:cysteine desulfurase [Rhodospirillaceae bacterium]